MDNQNTKHVLKYSAVIINIVLFSVGMDERLYPPFINAFVGSNVVFQCNSVGNTKWFFDQGELPGNADILPKKSPTLRIQDFNFQNEGKLYCYGQLEKSGEYFVAESKINVIGE